MEYAIAKWLHVLSSTVLFGTGIGSAYYFLAAALSRDARTAASVAGYVVVADWLFTATTAIAQPLTGYWMVRVAGMGWDAAWLRWSVGLYIVAIACWLPVVWLQMRLRDLARAAAARGAALPPAYWRYFRLWFALGVVAFVAFVAIFYLMTVKPA
ncbi:DUF2269 family protein [Bordetella genomosp. 2]|uniref:DUF2269 domain-containing protein n=1 Tax=Bordetella genomosp. 2 TaxID=1983456 RepID=A0A261VFN2_9BORD|nr:DUF2269 domain-containing protein [Bordetella genomosp. 2]OZI72571.1 hypothetical protein CAL24_19990 [Bordetella genomosp. 2]